jgi:hypothetical protein
MTAKLVLELTMEEAAALSHLISNSSMDDLRKKAMSQSRAELLVAIYQQLPAFDPPPRLTAER